MPHPRSLSFAAALLLSACGDSQTAELTGTGEMNSASNASTTSATTAVGATSTAANSTGGGGTMQDADSGSSSTGPTDLCDLGSTCTQLPLAMGSVDYECPRPDAIPCQPCALPPVCPGVFELDVSSEDAKFDRAHFECVARGLRDGIPGHYVIHVRELFGSHRVEVRVLANRIVDIVRFDWDDITNRECRYEIGSLRPAAEFDVILNVGPVGWETAQMLLKPTWECRGPSSLQCPATGAPLATEGN